METTAPFPQLPGCWNFPERLLDPYPIPSPNALERGPNCVHHPFPSSHTPGPTSSPSSGLVCLQRGCGSRVFRGGSAGEGRLLVCELEGHPQDVQHEAWTIPHNTVTQPHCLFCSLNTPSSPMPQGFCTCCFFYLEGCPAEFSPMSG